MLWHVSHPDGDYNLDPNQLVVLLASGIVNTNDQESETLVSQLAKYLESFNILSTSSITNLLYLAFRAGYLYHVFKTKNEVRIVTPESIVAGITNSSGEPGSPDYSGNS